MIKPSIIQICVYYTMFIYKVESEQKSAVSKWTKINRENAFWFSISLAWKHNKISHDSLSLIVWLCVKENNGPPFGVQSDFPKLLVEVVVNSFISNFSAQTIIEFVDIGTTTSWWTVSIF